MKQVVAAFLIVCFQSGLADAGDLDDHSPMSMIPDDSYLKLLQGFEVPFGEHAVRFFEGKIVPPSHKPPENSLSATCAFWGKKSSNVRVIPATVDDQCACIVLKAAANLRVLKIDAVNNIQGTLSYLKESANFDTFHCYKENGGVVTIGEMKAAIRGFLELHLPVLPIMICPENYKFMESTTSVVPSKANVHDCCTLL